MREGGLFGTNGGKNWPVSNRRVGSKEHEHVGKPSRRDTEVAFGLFSPQFLQVYVCTSYNGEAR